MTHSQGNKQTLTVADVDDFVFANGSSKTSLNNLTKILNQRTPVTFFAAGSEPLVGKLEPVLLPFDVPKSPKAVKRFAKRRQNRTVNEINAEPKSYWTYPKYVCRQRTNLASADLTPEVVQFISARDNDPSDYTPKKVATSVKQSKVRKFDSSRSDEAQSFDNVPSGQYRFPKHYVSYATRGAALNRVACSDISLCQEKLRAKIEELKAGRIKPFVVVKRGPIVPHTTRVTCINSIKAVIGLTKQVEELKHDVEALCQSRTLLYPGKADDFHYHVCSECGKFYYHRKLECVVYACPNEKCARYDWSMKFYEDAFVVTPATVAHFECNRLVVDNYELSSVIDSDIIDCDGFADLCERQGDDEEVKVQGMRRVCDVLQAVDNYWAASDSSSEGEDYFDETDLSFIRMMNEAEEKSYCCARKCFVTPSTQVDGIACMRCKHFSWCACNCISFKQSVEREELARKERLQRYEQMAAHNYQIGLERARRYFANSKRFNRSQFEKEMMKLSVLFDNDDDVVERQLDSNDIWTALSSRSEGNVVSDFWNDIVFRSKVTFVSWLTFMMTVYWFYSPVAGSAMLISTIAASSWKSVTGFIQRSASEVVAPVIDRGTQLVERIDSLVKDAPETVNAAVDKVVEGLTSIGSVCTEQGVSIKNLCAAINQHKIGIGANIALLASAKDINQLVYILISTFSMVGLEQSIVNSFIGRLYSSFVPEAVERQGFDGISVGLSDFWSRHKLSWDVKRLSGVAGLLTSVFGITMLGKDVMAPITKANANSEAIEKIWDKLEEYLNSLGFLNTGKWAYMKEIEQIASQLVDDFNKINIQMGVAPAYFCTSAGYAKWLDFKKRFAMLDTICRKNTCPDLKSNKLFVSIQTMNVKLIAWDAEIERVRCTNGKRVEPVGVCLVGASQLGKSKLRSEIVRRVCSKLEKISKDDPTQLAFHGASHWQTWNVQCRDEYDQGYNGQEITYMDDGFADKEHKDHQMWLSFISGEAIGTVQAALAEKGLPYASKLCLVSCNNLPRSSISINNIEALHRRFPFCIAVRLVKGKQRKGPDDEYDPNFEHLEYHVSSMNDHCLLGGAQCNWTRGDDTGVCDCASYSLDEICEQIARMMVSKQLKYDTEMDSFIGRAKMEAAVSWAEAVERQVDPGFSYPEFKVIDRSASWRLKSAVLKAYQQPVLDTWDCSSVLEWAQYLESSVMHQPNVFYEVVMYHNIRDVFELLALLPILRVRDGCEELFSKAWMKCFANPRRIRDTRLDTDYLYGFQINYGKSLYAIPSIEGVIKEFDVLNADHKLVLDMVNATVGDEAVVPNTDYYVYNIVQLPWPHYISMGYANVVINRVLFGDVVGLSVFAAEMFKSLNNVVKTREYVMNSWAARRIAVMANPLYKYTSFVSVPFWNGLIWINNKLKESLEFVTGICNTVRNCFTYMFYFIADWLGMDFGNVCSQLVNLVIDKMAMATVGVVAAMIIGFIWGIFSFFSNKEAELTEPQKYEGSKVITARKVNVKPRVATRQLDSNSIWSDASRYVKNLIGMAVVERERSAESQKINYYESDISCPLCDPEVYNADGVVNVGEGYLSKPNRFPLWQYHRVIFNEEHKLDCPLLDGSIVDEMCFMIEDARSEGHKWFGFEKCFGKMSGGSVPHNHIKWYNSNKNVNDFEFDNSYISACVNKYGVAYDIVTHGGDANRRIIELSFACKDDYDSLYDTFHTFDSLFEKANASSWYMSGYVTDGWLYSTVTLLSPSNVEGVYGWSKSEITEFRNNIKVLLGYVYGSVDLFSRDPVCAFDAFAQEMSSVAVNFNLLQMKPESWKHEHVCKKCGVKYVHWHSFKHAAHGQFANQCPNESCEWYHQGDNPTGSEKQGYESQKVIKKVVKPVRREIVKPQSCDDASLDLLNVINNECSVMVARMNADGSGDWENVDNVCRGSLFGLACDRYVFLPSHLVPMGGFVKIFKADNYKNRDELYDRDYCLAQVQFVDAEKEFAMARTYSRPEAIKMVKDLFGINVKFERGNGKFHYSKMLLNHVMDWEEWQEVMSRGVGVVQWLPKLRCVTTGTAFYKGITSLSVKDENGVHVEYMDLLEVYGIQSSINVTMKGDCGGVVMAMNPRVVKKVLGMHSFGSKTSAHSTMLYKELLEKAMNEVVVQREMSVVKNVHTKLDISRAGHGSDQLEGWPEVEWSEHDPWNLEQSGSPINLPRGDDVAFVARTKINPVEARQNIEDSIMARRSSSWRRSPFYSAFPVETEPSPLDPKDKRIEVDLPKNVLNQPSLYMGPNSVMGRVLPEPDGEILDDMFNQLLPYWISVLSGEDMSTPNDLEKAMDQGLNGVNENLFVHGMVTHASCGTPWNVVPSLLKQDCIDVSADGVRTFKESPAGRKLESVCRLKLSEMKKGKRVRSYCLSKLKNNLIKKSHVKIGKTRIYNSSAVEDVVVGNALFGQFKEAFMKHQDEFCHAIGINVHSLEWRVLYEKLAKHPNWLDVDYKNFDKHLPSVFMRLGYKLMIETIKQVSPDEWTHARYVAAETFINSLMVDVDTIYMTEHSNKSGDVLTTITNSIVNFLFMYYCFIKCTGVKDLHEFLSNVCFRTMGDDIVMTVSNMYKERFNFVAIQKCLESFGQEATSAAKTGEKETEFSDQSVITFLKRRFVVDGVNVFAPLPPSVVQSTFGWTQIAGSEVEIWYEIIRNHMFEAMLNGEDYYNYFMTRLRSCARTIDKSLLVRINSLWIRSYQSVKDEYLSILYGYVERQGDGDSVILRDMIADEYFGLYDYLYNRSGESGGGCVSIPLNITFQVNDLGSQVQIVGTCSPFSGLPYLFIMTFTNSGEALVLTGSGSVWTSNFGDITTSQVGNVRTWNILLNTASFSWTGFSLTVSKTPTAGLVPNPCFDSFSTAISSSSGNFVIPFYAMKGDVVSNFSCSVVWNTILVQSNSVRAQFDFPKENAVDLDMHITLASTERIMDITCRGGVWALDPFWGTTIVKTVDSSGLHLVIAYDFSVYSNIWHFVINSNGNLCTNRVEFDCNRNGFVDFVYSEPIGSVRTVPSILNVNVPRSKVRNEMPCIVERQSDDSEVCQYGSDNEFSVQVCGAPTYMPKIPGLLSCKEADEVAENGGILSEVGYSRELPWVNGFIPGYVLREHSTSTTLYHKYGYLNLGKAWAVPAYQNLSLSSGVMVLDPNISQMQQVIMNEYASARMLVVWVLRFDEPLGGSHLIEIMPSFIDNTSSRRGIRWKPKECPTVALGIGWEWTRPYIRTPIDIADITAARTPLFPGFSLELRLLEDNSTSTLNTPIQFCAWNIVADVECFGYLGAANSYTNSVVKWPLLASTLTSSTSEPVERQMDPAPVVEGEGGEQASIVSEEKKVNVFQSAEPKEQSVASVSERGQVQDPATRWYPWFEITLDSTSVNVPVVQSIIPYSFPGGGESLSLPFRRNLFVTGSWEQGFCKAMEVKVISNRAPMFAGLLELSCGQLASWGGQRLGVGFHELGKGETTHFLLFDQHYVDYTSQEGLRALVSPWISTSVASCSLTLNCVSMNKTQDIESIKVRVFIRPAGCKFMNPQRPLPLAVTNISSRISDLSQLAHQLAITEVVERQMDVVPHNSTRPTGFGYADGTTHSIVQDDFWLKIGTVNVSITGTAPTSAAQFKIDINNIVDMFSSTAGASWNVLTEKLQRFHYCVPFNATGFGAVFGKYKLVVRLPTNISANIEHVCLSSDMSVQSAAILSGASTPMAYGGAKVVSFGAIQNSGLYQGANKVDVNTSSGGDVNEVGSDDMGWLPASRFATKYCSFANEVGTNTTNAAFPTLSMRVTDFVSNPSPTTTSPIVFTIVILVNFKGLKFEWNVWDRVASLPPAVTTLFSPQEIGQFAQYALAAGNNDLASKALARVARANFKKISLDGIENESNLTVEEISSIKGFIKEYNIYNRIANRVIV